MVTIETGVECAFYELGEGPGDGDDQLVDLQCNRKVGEFDENTYTVVKEVQRQLVVKSSCNDGESKGGHNEGCGKDGKWTEN